MKTDHSILSAYLDGELDSPWKEMLEKRLENDPALKNEFNALLGVKRSMESIPEPDWAKQKDVIWSRIQEKTRVIKPVLPLGRKRFTFSFPLAAAAALALVTGSMLTGFVWGNHSGQSASLELASRKLSPQEMMVLIEKANASPEVKFQIPSQYSIDVKNEGKLLRMTTFQQGER